MWSDSRTGDQEIFFKRSLDKGRTWSEQDILLSPDPAQAGSSRSPSISVAPNGRIDIVYYHTGAAAEVQGFDHVYWSFSNDGGGNFMTRQVNDMPIDRTKGYSGPAGSGGQVGNHYPPTVSSTDAAAFVVERHHRCGRTHQCPGHHAATDGGRRRRVPAIAGIERLRGTREAA